MTDAQNAEYGLVQDALAAAVPGLHEETLAAVAKFSVRLAQKLEAAETKYGVSTEWMETGWQQACQMHLLEHVFKGDPRDVAAYAMFMDHHGWRSFHLGGLLKYAENEISILEDMHPDHENTGAWDDTRLKIRMLIGTLGSLGLSGGEAPYILQMFEKLSNWIPLSPITGDTPGEWEDRTVENGEPLWQNMRLFSLLKDGRGRIYETRGPIQRYPDGRTAQVANARQEVTLPYTPGPVPIIDVDENGKSLQSEATVTDWTRNNVKIANELNNLGVAVSVLVVEEWTNDQCLEAVSWYVQKNLQNEGVFNGWDGSTPGFLKEYM